MISGLLGDNTNKWVRNLCQLKILSFSTAGMYLHFHISLVLVCKYDPIYNYKAYYCLLLFAILLLLLLLSFCGYYIICYVFTKIAKKRGVTVFY
jgi:hypothetical protein